MVDAPPRLAVFVTDAVEVGRPCREIEQRLVATGPQLLPLAHQATVAGQAILVTLGPAVGEHIVGVPARVRLGPRWTRSGCPAFPIRWEAAAFESLFPVLDGTLVISPLGPDRCKLGIEASYRPPLDRVGALLDRVLLHRVAESTVREFLRRLGTALSHP